MQRRFLLISFPIESVARSKEEAGIKILKSDHYCQGYGVLRTDEKVQLKLTTSLFGNILIGFEFCRVRTELDVTST